MIRDTHSVSHDYGVLPTSEDMPNLSVRTAVSAAALALGTVGVASPRVDAELIAAHVLGVPRGRLALVPDFDPEQRLRFQLLVDERLTRVPLQHLVGSAPFRELELAVGPGVFVPRPETELLVDWALRRVPRDDPVVVDLCSGSGAIALAVATEVPGSTVYCVERDPAALAWLRRNVAAVAPRVRVVEADIRSGAALSTLDGEVDLVLCNPPYVPEGTLVAPEVGEFDPHDAVFAGRDGLALMPAVAARAAALLRPGGWLAVEHDDSHGEAVPMVLSRHGGFADIADHRDLAGRPRFTVARRMAD
jgi:release factor glutamine methyltransferase